jgi:hypothetical protein
VRQRNWGQFLSLESLNIRNYQKFVEKLRYIHRNPVKAGLCERPEDWEWSSSPLRNRLLVRVFVSSIFTQSRPSLTARYWFWISL